MLNRARFVLRHTLLNAARWIVLDPRRMRITSLILFALTALSAYLTGGVVLMLAALGILVAHEMGHLVAARYHGIPTTWPFFIPAPILNPLTGTLGAVMAVQAPFPSRRALFDVGVAGPLSGFAVCLLVLHLGAHEFVYFPKSQPLYELGTPLLCRILPGTLPGEIPPGMIATRGGPLQTAAWFGLLLTGLNLIPIGQFDGGHLVYAVLPRHAHRLARAFWWACLALVVLSPSWLFWAILARLLGRPHPPTMDDQQPLGFGRPLLALVALAAFVVSFIPEPVQNSWSALFGDVPYLVQ
jgi:membrane-associated protease RseP (regulator of RpoE activity)